MATAPEHLSSSRSPPAFRADPSPPPRWFSYTPIPAVSRKTGSLFHNQERRLLSMQTSRRLSPSARFPPRVATCSAPLSDRPHRIPLRRPPPISLRDRKSTRLNSSHSSI